MIIDQVSDKICMRQFKNWSKYSDGIIHNTPWKMWRTRQIPVPDASSYLTIRIIFTHLASLHVVSRTRSNVLLWSCPQIALGSFNKVFQADILLVYWRGALEQCISNLSKHTAILLHRVIPPLPNHSFCWYWVLTELNHSERQVIHLATHMTPL